MFTVCVRVLLSSDENYLYLNWSCQRDILCLKYHKTLYNISICKIFIEYFGSKYDVFVKNICMSYIFLKLESIIIAVALLFIPVALLFKTCFAI